ncbi:MAG: hypothetical protein IKK81_07610 [Prevotella sp.]|nr:hypothetical protein [Prevotella sp.]
MNSEMKQLLNKFLEGTTTLEEEKLLGRMLADNDVPAELKALAELLKAEPCDASDAEEWLAEDLTDEFDRIVSRRKQHTVIRRLIAAASVLLIVGIGALLWFGSEDKANDVVVVSDKTMASSSMGESAYPSATEVIDESAEVLSGRNDVKPQQKAEIEIKTEPDTMPSTTLSEEQLNTILAAHQAKLHEIDDSVDMAHIKDYIENDEQLYKIGQKALCLTCED